MSSVKSGKRWVVPTVLVVACLGSGAWALPQFFSAQNMRDGADSAYSAPAAQVPATVEEKGEVDTAALESRLAKISEDFTGGTITGMVVDAESGQTLYAEGADQPRVPASNFKLLTDFTLFQVEDPSARFRTEVKQSGQNLTLVAGGDTLLGTGESKEDQVVGHAGLRTLAQQVVDSLEPGTYTLDLDSSRFTGPDLNPAWAQEDIDAGFVSRISPLAFYSHHSPGENGKSTEQRPENADQQVQQYLLDDLNELGKGQGLTFELGSETQAAEAAETVGSVESATVAEQSALMMQESDNMLAETLARNASVASGGDGSFESARQLVLDTLTSRGISTDQLTISDLSGLSLDNRVTNQTLVQIMQKMVDGEGSASASLAGLPVAGGSGTLEDRFDDSDEAAARGWARAKTGTLNSVISLTGYTTTESGHTLIYSFITNDVESATAARDALDESVAAVTEL